MREFVFYEQLNTGYEHGRPTPALSNAAPTPSKDATGLQSRGGMFWASDVTAGRHGVPFGVLRTRVATACAGRQWCLGWPQLA